MGSSRIGEEWIAETDMKGKGLMVSPSQSFSGEAGYALRTVPTEVCHAGLAQGATA